MISKNYYFLFILFTLTSVFGQTPVQVGAGSYASYPPDEELEFVWDGVTYYTNYDFVHNDPIYVSEGETRPIPTNDWWTNILVEQYGGLLFAYPLVMQPTSEGLKIQYPIDFNDNGTDLDRGNGLLIKGENYNPDKAIAKDWSDWSVLMGMPDSNSNSNMDVTMSHGIPFTHIETENVNPIITTNSGATYFNADGSAASFPIEAGSEFIISTEGRLFGIHLGNNATANLTGQQHITIDLGEVFSLTAINLIWETAYASGYAIEVSEDNSNWTTVHTISNGDGGTDSHSLSNNARYVRILLLEKGSIYEYSLFEIEVFENSTNVALNKTAYASSQEGAFSPDFAIDGNGGTRWASAPGAQEQLIIDMNEDSNHFVVSALTQFSDLNLFKSYAHNKPIETKVDYIYDVSAGKINTTWNITTENLKGETAGNTVQGFIPHQYKNTTSTDVSYIDKNYVTSRGQLKSAIGKSFSFSYNFGGILPNFNKPYKNIDDENPYIAEQLYKLVSDFASRKNSYGGDTYWGGKDLVNIAKYALIAKELNHQSYDKLKALSKESLVDWLTYTPGEEEHYYARYDRWKALVGFNESFGSVKFTDNHFHYGYLIYAASLYSMLDDEFLSDYGEMLQLVCKQYANWERDDDFLPYLRTFDPWIGHSYAGGTGSGSGNNQESTSEAMQSWIGMFLLGEMMGDNEMRDAGAFGYTSEASATLEYWFDWDEENLPAAYNHNIVGILWNGGFAYGTYFSASPVHIHGIQYLPVNPGFKYLAQNKTWANREYNDMMTESLAFDGYSSESEFGDDWAHVALGFRSLFDTEYVSKFIDENIALGESNENYIMDYEVAGISYFYTHAMQNLGDFSFKYRTDFPASSVFEENGEFSYASAYNSTNTDKTCNIFDATGNIIDSFLVPAKTLVTYPELPIDGQSPENCYSLSSSVGASSGDATATSAIDGNFGTRWIAASTDPCTFDIDLGIKCSIDELEIFWETASASDYDVLVSNDQVNWTTAKVFTDLAYGERKDVIDTIDEEYQFIRLSMKKPSTVWPYSIFEINICGEVSATLSDPNTFTIDNVVSLYPNPVSSNLTLSGKITNSKIKLYTPTGLLVYATDAKSNLEKLDISNLAAGVYYLKIEGLSGAISFIKK